MSLIDLLVSLALLVTAAALGLELGRQRGDLIRLRRRLDDMEGAEYAAALARRLTQ